MIEFKPCVYKGEVTPPPSKSISHRALICAAMCENKTSIINNISLCDDVLLTVECLKKLGAKITINGNTATVAGTDIVPKSSVTLDAGQCGSTLRFILPFLMLSEEESMFNMDRRLSERPLDVYEDIASEQMLTFEHQEDCSLKVGGPMSTGFFRIKGNVSSQFTTGLMLALASQREYSVIEFESEIVSLPYILMTADVMAEFGYGVTLSDNRIIIDGNIVPHGTEIDIEADWSSAAVLLAHNMLGSEIEIDNINPESIQGDRAIKYIFGKIRRTCPEINISDCPDLSPVIIAVAPFYNGVVLTGTDRLKDKECDRGEAMKTELAKFGVDITVGDDYISVPKCDVYCPDEIIRSHNDHRIAMAMSVILSVTGGMLDGEDCVSKSYPKYFEMLDGIRFECKED